MDTLDVNQLLDQASAILKEDDTPAVELIVAAEKPEQLGTDLTSANDNCRVISSATDVVVLITWLDIV